MFAQALRVALQLMLFRSGPQDMPYAPSLTRMLAALSVAMGMLLLSPVTPLPLAFATGVGGVAGIAFFVRQLLKGRKLDNRFSQVLTAHLLTGSLFALALWPAFNAMAPAMLEVMEKMRAGYSLGTDADGQLAVTGLPAGKALSIAVPGWAALWSDLIFVWSLVVATRINRLAADLNTPSSVLLTLLSLFVLMGFVLTAQLLVALVIG